MTCDASPSVRGYPVSPSMGADDSSTENAMVDINCDGPDTDRRECAATCGRCANIANDDVTASKRLHVPGRVKFIEYASTEDREASGHDAGLSSDGICIIYMSKVFDGDGFIGCTKSGIESNGGPCYTITCCRIPEYRCGPVSEMADGVFTEDTCASYSIRNDTRNLFTHTCPGDCTCGFLISFFLLAKDTCTSYACAIDVDRCHVRSTVGSEGYFACDACTSDSITGHCGGTISDDAV